MTDTKYHVSVFLKVTRSSKSTTGEITVKTKYESFYSYPSVATSRLQEYLDTNNITPQAIRTLRVFPGSGDTIIVIIGYYESSKGGDRAKVILVEDQDLTEFTNKLGKQEREANNLPISDIMCPIGGPNVWIGIVVDEK